MSPPQPITRVIELTPPGRAAVAVVLIAGPDAVRAVDACFHAASGRRLADVPMNRICLGRWGGDVGEELIACRRADDAVEIHCHGGTAAVRVVIDALSAHGCQTTRWQDWLRENATDPIRAAAQVALADAPTGRTAAVLLDQLQGSLTAAIYATLNAVAAGDWQTAAATLEVVLAQRGLGLHLTTPWRVVLAGRPNVGKSSLLNALVGFQRAIVCEQPGTTRDVVTASTAIDGWPVQLADTAGLREAGDEIESAGVARATAAAANADLVMVVDDSAASAANEWPFATPVLRVLNKIDLLPLPARQLAQGRWSVLTSAVTGEGVAELVTAIGQVLVPAPPAAGAAVPFTMDHVRLLEDARAAVARQEAAAAAVALQSLVGPAR